MMKSYIEIRYLFSIFNNITIEWLITDVFNQGIYCKFKFIITKENKHNTCTLYDNINGSHMTKGSNAHFSSVSLNVFYNFLHCINTNFII